jgi:hypothetical protein
MTSHDHHGSGLRLPNTLDVPDCHTALVVGHFLRRIYADLLADDQPERLTALVNRLEARERDVIHASPR